MLVLISSSGCSCAPEKYFALAFYLDGGGGRVHGLGDGSTRAIKVFMEPY